MLCLYCIFTKCTRKITLAICHCMWISSVKIFTSVYALRSKKIFTYTYINFHVLLHNIIFYNKRQVEYILLSFVVLTIIIDYYIDISLLYCQYFQFISYFLQILFSDWFFYLSFLIVRTDTSLVRTMRFELIRHKAHASETCLSTNSSMLAIIKI